MRSYNEVLFCLSIVLQAFFIEGVCGGSIETSGSSSSYFTGLHILLTVIAIVISLIAFLCTVIRCLQYLRNRNRPPGIPVVVIGRIGELPSNSQPSNSREIRLMVLQPENRVSNTAPPADSEMDQPIFNVQSEVRRLVP